MAEDPNHTHPTYKQPIKQAARTKALTHAVDLLTNRREQCAVLPSDYTAKVLAKVRNRENDREYQAASVSVDPEDLESWNSFRASTIGSRSAGDLTVAYLSGPEPTNDLEALIGLGVRPENIWAFEVDGDVFSSALRDIERSNLRGVKLMEVSIEDYFLSTPRRFDIIYFDACGPLPSKDKKTTQAIVNIFRHSALAPLGVLITNFSAPDVSKEQVAENYSRLVASYLYPKRTLDTFDKPEHTITASALEHGYSLPLFLEEYDEKEWYEKNKDFLVLVRENFLGYYGSFLTRHMADIASIVAPTMRLLSSPLKNQIVNDIEQAAARGRRFTELGTDGQDDAYSDANAEAETRSVPMEWPAPDDTQEHPDAEVDLSPTDGSAYGDDASHYSLLFTMGACRLLAGTDRFTAISDSTKKFCTDWKSQLAGKPNNSKDVPMADKALSCFYALRHDKTMWAAPLQRLASFDYWREMRFLCDVPTEELAFYPAFSQVAYPAHNNVKETRRFSYVAEGKSTTMMLDVLPFDECRYVYDWLSTAPLIGSDWKDESRQLVFRFALDGIAKNSHNYQDDFLFGCHAVGIDDGEFEASMYRLREELSHVRELPASEETTVKNDEMVR